MEFLLALGLFQAICLGAILLALLIAVSFDSSDENSYKWSFLFLLPIFYVVLEWNNLTFSGVLHSITLASLIPLAEYIGIGILYSTIEFRATIRDSAAFFAEKRAKSQNWHTYTYMFMRIKQTVAPDGTEDYIPYIAKPSLADKLMAWTIMWPVYLIDYILGKFLFNMFSKFATLLTNMTKNYIAKVFSNAFKEIK